MANAPFEVLPGRPHPLGSMPDANGVNFAVFSSHATAVELLIFDEHDDPDPVQIIQLDPRNQKTFHFWHCYVKGLTAGAHYGYRVAGPLDVNLGHRFDPQKLLVDPYALGNTNHLWDRVDACRPGDNVATSMRSVVIDPTKYDWEGDQPLARPMSETIVYEAHVRGFTKSPTSKVKNPGTFAGLIEKIPYLKSLGITAIEFLPVFEFDDKEVVRLSPVDGKALVNFWGYSTFGFFAPQSWYCVTPEEGTHLDEFRDMVKELHKAGIEVILDVVFNHTSEGNHQGPTINFRGLENSAYYHLVQNDKQYYMDYSGCGNTVNCNHPLVAKLILECLEFWVREMHVDGFRFDEGSILSRGPDGTPLVDPPVIWQIELSEQLADTKLIAEAWDAAGLYQIGYFPGARWAEWNGKFRDDVRSFIKGDRGIVGKLASRMAGSSDLYEATGHLPINSVNFVACHDGFTLNDLVSYDSKHNDANGEGNRDGIDDNLSWNCGVEGPTDDVEIERLRARIVRNSAVISALSQGVWMFVAGDEVRRTQLGNNNAYCQDNEISWFDWTLPDKNADVLRFFSEIIRFRKTHPILHRSRFFSGQLNSRGLLDIAWHGCHLGQPGWNDPECGVLAMTLGGFDGDCDIHAMMNMEDRENAFDLPALRGRSWYRSVDTFQASPEDIAHPGREVEVKGRSYPVGPRSIVVLISKDSHGH